MRALTAVEQSVADKAEPPAPALSPSAWPVHLLLRLGTFLAWLEDFSAWLGHLTVWFDHLATPFQPKGFVIDYDEPEPEPEIAG